MGARYGATCNSCRHEFKLVKGGGWLWYQKVCNTCGKHIRVPRQGPEDFEDGVTITYLQLVKHLADGSPKWSRRGGSFDEVERKMLNEMTSICLCGGSLISETSKDIIYRCPQCKSPDLYLEEDVIFD